MKNLKIESSKKSKNWFLGVNYVMICVMILTMIFLDIEIKDVFTIIFLSIISTTLLRIYEEN